jgi:FK506-binding protein 1
VCACVCVRACIDKHTLSLSLSLSRSLTLTHTGNKAAAPAAAASSASPGKEEVSEAELRALMEAAGKKEIQGYSLDVPPGRQAGYKQVKKVVEPNASAASMAVAPPNTGVTDLGGVKVTTIRAGDKRTFPQRGDTLTMHYVGKLRDTKQVFDSSIACILLLLYVSSSSMYPPHMTHMKQVFDSSIARGQPFQFVIGEGMVIRGWDEGILKMTLGEKAQLVIQSDYGYGPRGQGKIPPNADLVFDVDLLAINDIKAGGRFSGGN